MSIVSAGLEAMPGSPHAPDRPCHSRGAGRRSERLTPSPVDPDRVAKSDVIFVMEIPQLVELRKRFPEARAKTFLLSCLAPDPPLEIDDPIDGDEAAFQVCFEHISRAVRPIVCPLSETAPHLKPCRQAPPWAMPSSRRGSTPYC